MQHKKKVDEIENDKENDKDATNIIRITTLRHNIRLQHFRNKDDGISSGLPNLLYGLWQSPNTGNNVCSCVIVLIGYHYFYNCCCCPVLN